MEALNKSVPDLFSGFFNSFAGKPDYRLIFNTNKTRLYAFSKN